MTRMPLMTEPNDEFVYILTYIWTRLSNFPHRLFDHSDHSEAWFRSQVKLVLQTVTLILRLEKAHTQRENSVSVLARYQNEDLNGVSAQSSLKD